MPRFRSINFAMALAATSAVALSMAMPVEQALAAKEKAKKPEYSKEISPVAQEIQKALEAGDTATAQAKLTQAEALMSAPDDKFLVGNFYIQLAGKMNNDQAMQKKGVMLMLESGVAPADSVPRLNFYAGQFAFQDKNYAKASQYLTQAKSLGFADDNLDALIAEARFQQGDVEGGLNVLSEAIAAREAAGSVAPEDWYRRGTAKALENKLTGQIGPWTKKLVTAYPTPENWRIALSLYRDSAGLEAQDTLDLMRLMRQTGALVSERDYAEYTQAANPVRLPGEVIAVIEEGQASGAIPATSTFAPEELKLAKGRVAADKADLPSAEKDARSSANGVTALATADAFLAYGQYDKAAELYAVAMSKGGIDAQRAALRLGIANALRGDNAAAMTAFGQVTDGKKPIADFWTLWLDNKQSASAAPTAAASTTPSES
jgi:hypothetical protein